MDEKRFEELLLSIVTGAMHDDSHVVVNYADGEPLIDTVHTFFAAGVLSNNAGLVIRLENGDEFQVTIVQSRRGLDSQ